MNHVYDLFTNSSLSGAKLPVFETKNMYFDKIKNKNKKIIYIYIYVCVCVRERERELKYKKKYDKNRILSLN